MRLRRHFYCARILDKIYDRLCIIDHFDGLKLKQRDYVVKTGYMLKMINDQLDSDYHEVITDKEFIKWGHIYYNEGGKPKSRVPKVNKENKNETTNKTN
tara:strand:- start:1315 stop:1611 length:297 start_codon:yes stop_codon:yes gene_type:complete